MDKSQTLEKRILKFKGTWTGGKGMLYWMGLGSCPNADSGKFTMEIELNSDGTFSGTTTDKHGKANVEGALTNTEINLTKEYILGESASNARKLIYENGKRHYFNPDKFEGKWYQIGDEKMKRSFELTLIN